MEPPRGPPLATPALYIWTNELGSDGTATAGRRSRFGASVHGRQLESRCYTERDRKGREVGGVSAAVVVAAPVLGDDLVAVVDYHRSGVAGVGPDAIRIQLEVRNHGDADLADHPPQRVAVGVADLVRTEQPFDE